MTPMTLEAYWTRWWGASWSEGLPIGPYVLVERIQAGGFGEVWLASAADGTLVALKRQRPESGASELEVKVLETLRACRFVPRLLHSGVHADTPYIAMEYIDGMPLGDWLTQTASSLTSERTIRILRGLLQALHALHREGFLHLDIKPANIMIRTSGVPVLIDFGIAQRFDDTGRGTGPRTIAMTSVYASPEAAMSQEVGPASDIYQVGLVGYELLVRRGPFLTIREREAEKWRLLSASGAPAALQAAIRRALSGDKSSRFQSASEFLLALDEIELADEATVSAFVAAKQQWLRDNGFAVSEVCKVDWSGLAVTGREVAALVDGWVRRFPLPAMLAINTMEEFRRRIDRLEPESLDLDSGLDTVTEHLFLTRLYQLVSLFQEATARCDRADEQPATPAAPSPTPVLEATTVPSVPSTPVPNIASSALVPTVSPSAPVQSISDSHVEQRGWWTRFKRFVLGPPSAAATLAEPTRPPTTTLRPASRPTPPVSTPATSAPSASVPQAHASNDNPIQEFLRLAGTCTPFPTMEKLTRLEVKFDESPPDETAEIEVTWQEIALEVVRKYASREYLTGTGTSQWYEHARGVSELIEHINDGRWDGEQLPPGVDRPLGSAIKKKIERQLASRSRAAEEASRRAQERWREQWQAEFDRLTRSLLAIDAGSSLIAAYRSLPETLRSSSVIERYATFVEAIASMTRDLRPALLHKCTAAAITDLNAEIMRIAAHERDGQRMRRRHLAESRALNVEADLRRVEAHVAQQSARSWLRGELGKLKRAPDEAERQGADLEREIDDVKKRCASDGRALVRRVRARRIAEARNADEQMGGLRKRQEAEVVLEVEAIVLNRKALGLPIPLPEELVSAALIAKHDHEVRKLQESAAGERQRLRTESRSELKAIRQRHDAELSKCQSVHDATVAQRAADHRCKRDELRAEYHKRRSAQHDVEAELAKERERREEKHRVEREQFEVRAHRLWR